MISPSENAAPNGRTAPAFRHLGRRKTDPEAGYSLLEILVVLAIIAILVTLVAPRLFSQVDRSKVTGAQAQARSLRLALDSYRLDIGRYPTQEQGLSVLVQAPDGSPNWFGPYLDGEIPLDPWGNSYVYVEPGLDAAGRQLSPSVISYGADGAPGGSGDAADISS
ncbi:MAG: type II secretion system major pseudopilin GspG [Litorimonas sp.]